MKILQDWHIERNGSELGMKEVGVDILADKLGKFYCETKLQQPSESTIENDKDYHKNTWGAL
ncbi:hypothetical protein KUTeg_014355 [Tegillarca granosa]|uniref:Uncharacterized protein n=1 Tax=Tegillarca granosa TaxID=220873 RepID=A0ABQ9EYU4_TEGGR|nr:hypothetical protein KUTeg_014355 [Tegillarca granosa]